jgi:hypothetical protein
LLLNEEGGGMPLFFCFRTQFGKSIAAAEGMPAYFRRTGTLTGPWRSGFEGVFADTLSLMQPVQRCAVGGSAWVALSLHIARGC